MCGLFYRHCEHALLRGPVSLIVIPRLDRGAQLKILKLLVFFIVFMDPWSSHGVTQ